MSLKNQLTSLAEIKAAGFKLVGSKSIPTGDGACWEATLAFGTQKLVRVSNGGYGGPDETVVLATPKLPAEAIRKHIATFFAIPAVQRLLKDSQIEMEGYSLEFKTITQAEFDTKKAAILANDVPVSNEGIEMAVQAMADIHESLASIKRKLKTTICYVKKGGDAKGEWYCCKAADTPDNRAYIQKRDDVDYFLADLVAGL